CWIAEWSSLPLRHLFKEAATHCVQASLLPELIPETSSPPPQLQPQPQQQQQQKKSAGAEFPPPPCRELEPLPATLATSAQVCL
ncbi:hypothetical protein DUNSADRAFT_9499, partial [Dunaliella salina]